MFNEGDSMQIVFLVLMFAVAYFLVFRPQQKRQKEAKKLRENLKKGNQVLTTGGIVGKVVEIKDSQVVVDVDRGTKITFEKSSISTVLEE